MTTHASRPSLSFILGALFRSKFFTHLHECLERRLPAMGSFGVKRRPLSVDTLRLNVTVASSVTIRQGPTPMLTVEGARGWENHVAITEADGCLKIEAISDAGPCPYVEIHLEMPHLEEVDAEGAIDLALMNVRWPSLKLTASAGAKLSGDGQLHQLAISTRGKCQVDLSHLVAGKVDASIESDEKQSIEFRATDALFATVLGSAHITVFGGPNQRECHVYGHGSVTYL